MELEYLTIGGVLDMIAEKSNDSYDWPYMATQADIDKLMR